MPFLRADFLGVHPDAVTLLAQAALGLPPLVYLALRRLRRGAGQAQGAS